MELAGPTVASSSPPASARSASGDELVGRHPAQRAVVGRRGERRDRGRVLLQPARDPGAQARGVGVGEQQRLEQAGFEPQLERRDRPRPRWPARARRRPPPDRCARGGWRARRGRARRRRRRALRAAARAGAPGPDGRCARTSSSPSSSAISAAVRRRLRQRAGEMVGGEIGRALRGGLGGRRAQVGDGARVPGGLRGVPVRRDGPRAQPALAQAHRRGPVQRGALAGGHRVEHRGAHERMDEGAPVEDIHGVEPVERLRHDIGVQRRDRGDVVRRRAFAQHRDRARRRDRVGAQGPQPPLHRRRDTARPELRELLRRHRVGAGHFPREHRQQERVAAGGLERGVHDCRRAASRAAASRSSGRGRMTRGGGAQLVQQVVRGARLVRARGRDQRHAQAVDPAGEVLEEAQRGDVGPVQVVGEQHDGHGVGEVRGQPVEAVQHREAGVLGGAGGGIEDDAGVGRGARHQLRRGRPVEQLVHEPEPEPAVQLARPRVQHQRVTRRLPRRFEHGGLADARRTFQHEHGAGAVHGTGDRPRDRGELVLTRQQALKHPCLGYGAPPPTSSACSSGWRRRRRWRAWPVFLPLSLRLPAAVNFSVTLPAPLLTVTDPLATVVLPYLALTVCLPSLAPVSFSVRPFLSAAASLALVTLSLTVAPGRRARVPSAPGWSAPGPSRPGLRLRRGTRAARHVGRAPGRVRGAGDSSLPPSVNCGHCALAVNFGSVAMWMPSAASAQKSFERVAGERRAGDRVALLVRSPARSAPGSPGGSRRPRSRCS